MVKLPTSLAPIKNNDRVFIAGQTGSGKTVLSMSMLYKTERLLVIDSKNSLAKWDLPLYDQYTYDKIREGDNFRVRVVEDDTAIQYLNYIYEYGNAIVYIDEVTAIIPPRRNAPQVFVNIWNRGRELGIGAWAATQRPMSIPIFFISEAQHIFSFYLGGESDRKRIYEYVHDKRVKEIVPDPHGFYYYSQRERKVRYFSKLPT